MGSRDSPEAREVKVTQVPAVTLDRMEMRDHKVHEDRRESQDRTD